MHTPTVRTDLNRVLDLATRARIAARAAANQLEGARRTRATELEHMLAQAIAHAERLKSIVEGDARADAGAVR